jgi:hypothetical protein
LILANTFGEEWGNQGFIYAMYRCLALPVEEGGIWRNESHVVVPLENYEPQFTVKSKIKHDQRNKIKVSVGISTDMNATEPDDIKSFSSFNFQGGPWPMNGLPLDVNKPLEFGIDITQIFTEHSLRDSVKVFLMVYENDPESIANGWIYDFSVFTYNYDTTEYEVVFDSIEIINDSITIIPVDINVLPSILEIYEDTIVQTNENETLQRQLNAFGGEYPYKWELQSSYTESYLTAEYPEPSGEPTSRYTYFQKLEFPFTLYDKTYDSVYFSTFGALFFIDDQYQSYPYYIEDEFIISDNPVIAPVFDDFSATFVRDGLWYSSNDTCMTFNWRLSKYYIDDSEINVEAAVKLYKDGTIEFYYDTIENQSNKWIGGISSGDGENFAIYPYSSQELLSKGYCYKYKPFEVDPNIELTEDGFISYPAMVNGFSASIPIKVIDNQLNTSTKTIHLIYDFKEPEDIIRNMIYPNPFKNELFLNLKLEKDQHIETTITDISGKIHYYANEYYLIGEHQLIFQPNLQAGIYLLQVRYEGYKETFKLIKIP